MVTNDGVSLASRVERVVEYWYVEQASQFVNMLFGIIMVQF
jgi:hypothetical protein